MIRKSELHLEATRAERISDQVMRTDGEIGAASPGLFMFRYKSGGDNHIVCRQWDGTTEGTQNIKIAMGPQLQKQLRGVGYTYTDFQTRTRDSDGRAEFINQAYVADMVIFAMLCDATNVSVEITPAVGETPAVNEDAVWMEVLPPRHWSKAC